MPASELLRNQGESRAEDQSSPKTATGFEPPSANETLSVRAVARLSLSTVWT